jgi:hypothetical protein
MWMGADSVVLAARIPHRLGRRLRSTTSATRLAGRVDVVIATGSEGSFQIRDDVACVNALGARS